MNNFNLEIERLALENNGNYIDAIVDFQEEHKEEYDFHTIVALLDPIVLEKVKLTAYIGKFFPNKRISTSLDDIFQTTK